jgi:AraC-like DNA-binding protein
MIGKTRHAGAVAPGSSWQAAGDVFALDCGVLRHAASPGTYRHTRYPPTRALCGWVQHFWVESWDLQDHDPQIREVLPHPCVHLVLARGRSRVYGVQLERVVRELRGRDCIVGVKFRPGAFYPFLQRPVRSLTNRSVPATELLQGAERAEQEVQNCRDERALVEIASRLLLVNLPSDDSAVNPAGALVEEIARDRNVTRVEHLASRHNLSERTLQRLFSRYVGASARWVIKRYRVFEALGRLAAGRDVDFATLAQELGYYDQAHFINDFRKLVGHSPAAYLEI